MVISMRKKTFEEMQHSVRKMNVPCPNCGGMGVLFIQDDERECQRCKGEGTIEVEL